MQIFGINIIEESPVNKVLKPGWYPFGNFKKPNKYGYVHREETIPYEILNIYDAPNLPHITVSAIVGKNGSGKSSLIEIFFRIINNFTRHLIGTKRAVTDNRHLSLAYGVYADLHFESDNQQWVIKSRNTETSLVKVWPSYKEDIYCRNSHKANDFLSELFYTIVTNYSLYAYNAKEYGFESINSTNKRITGGEWLEGMFHKNDGYLTPIVITPKRDEGVIDIHNEYELGKQRIVKLALMAQIQGRQLLPGYKPDRLLVKFNSDYNGSKNEKITELLRIHMKGFENQVLEFISTFTRIWRKELKINYNTNRSNHILNTALYYLAYKTLKIILTYPDYRKYIKPQNSNSVRNYITHNLEIDAKRAVAEIKKEFGKNGEHNHLILKLEQTYNYIVEFQESGEFKWKDEDNIKVSRIINGIKNIRYSELFTILPPPFFNLDIKFTKRTNEKDSTWFNNAGLDVTISQLSSGERQLLNAISYVLYHIKNIESVIPDKERVRYKHICLVFDEVELYFHPDYQRTFVARLIEALKWCHIDKNIIKSIQIILITHSPFILSDVFVHNTLYLNEEGRRIEVEGESFGANYYSMLSNSFFFNESSVGKYSTDFISSLVINAEKGIKMVTPKASDRKLTDFIGDEIMRNYINNIECFTKS